MRSKNILLIITAFTCVTVAAQTLSPNVIPAQGGYYVAGATHLSWTLGETYTPTLTAGNNNLTQGFEQPEVEILTGALSGVLCTDSAVSVSFASTGIFDATNVFTAQLSDASGSFASPVAIGSVTGNFTSGTIAATLPGAASGAHYRIRVASSIPVYAGPPDSADISITSCCCPIWTGSTSNDWSTASNWTGNFIPNSCAVNVTIPSGTLFAPVISSTSISVGNISIASGVTLTLNGHDLNVCGNWAGGNGINAAVVGSGIVYLNSSDSAQTVSGNTTFNILQIANTSVWEVSLQGSGSIVAIDSVLQLASGIFNANGGTVTLISTANISAAYIDDFSGGFQGTYSGNITAQRYYGPATAFNDFSQHMLGPPVSGITLAALGSTNAAAAQYQPYTGVVVGAPDPNNMCDELLGAPGTPYGKVFGYVETNASSCTQNGWMVEAASTAASAGTGYSVVLGTGSGTLALTGPPNLLSTYSAATTNSGYPNTTSDQGRVYTSGINLISNPYPDYLLVSALVNDNSNFSPTVYVWNESTGSYYQPDTVPPFQAFKVIQTSDGAGSYVINGASRTATFGGTFQRVQNPMELNMTVTNNTTGLTDETTVGFNSNSTAQFNPAYDLIKMPGALNRHTLYSVNSNDWLWVNILKSISETSTVPVGFEPGVSGAYSTHFEGLNSFDPTSYITLEDTKLNIFHDVRSGDYTFMANADDKFNRFVLHFTPPASITTTDATCSEPGMINIVQPGTAMWNYTVADNNNTVISNGTLNNNSPVTVSVNAGVYTITLVDNNGYTVAKTIQVAGKNAVSASIIASATTVQQTETATFTATSGNATNYSWNFGDGAIATGAVVTHTYQQQGIYNVTLAANDASGCSATSSKPITVTSRSVTGINTIGANSISIWSNDNKVYVDFSNAGAVDAMVTIYDIIGQQISQEKFTGNAVYTKEVDNIEAGYLVVSARNGDDIVTRKVFIVSGK